MPPASRLTLALLVLIPPLLTTAGHAQPLTQALCPVPPIGNFNLKPTFTAFQPGDPGIPMLRRTIDTNLYPEARCNDGSPAVMYIRPANANCAMNPIVNPSSKWLIFLDGGGGCRNSDACLLRRWCSGGSEVFSRAGKMSSLGAPPAIHGNGIWSLAGPGGLVNHFRGYNHVLVHYCSSDNWIGSSKHVGLNTSTGTSFDIRFDGEAIVEAVIATLLSGNTAPDAVAAMNFYNTTLPNLQAATEVGLGGESAGSGGMRHHIDKLNFDRLQPAIADPEVLIWGVLDASLEPADDDPAIDWSDSYSPGDYSHHLLSSVEPGVRSFWGANDSALDASCLDPVWAADHVLDGGIHPQVCYDTNYTLRNHITTPVFVRQDINDPLVKDPFFAWKLFPDNDAYWAAQYAVLNDFAADVGLAAGLEAPLATPGVQGIKCNQHVAIQTDNGFFLRRVVGPGLPAHSFHNLLLNWVLGLPAGVAPGDPNSQQIQVDNSLVANTYTPSFCP